MQYFAYGSNLNITALETWCRKSGFRDALFSIRSPAVLHDHSLAFNRLSSVWGGGVLSIVPKRGSVVHGMVYDVNAAGAAALDRKEGVSVSAYARYPVYVETKTGVFGRAITYQAVVENPATFHRPADAYLETVLIGMSRHDLSGIDALIAAAQGFNQPSSVNGLIVYGTLRTGQPRCECLQPFVKLRKTCTLPGRLADMGDWPAYLCPADPAQTVAAEFVEVADIEAALTVCDQIEGYQGPEHPGNLFIRGLAEVRLNTGATRQGWLYRMPIDQHMSPHKLIPNGDWCSPSVMSADIA